MNIFNNRNVLLNVITQSRLRKWTPVFKMKMALLFLSALFLDKNYHKKTAVPGIINSFLYRRLF